MIVHDWEVRILIKEETTGKTVNTKATLEFTDIAYYYGTTYEGCEVTAMRMIDAEIILADLKYDVFKERYKKRQAEIIALEGQRPT